MKKPLRLDLAAEQEAEEAYGWYEAREPGLGERFLEQLPTTLERVEEAPEACSPVPGRFQLPVRAAYLKRYPYGVVFVELPDRFRVVAVAHLRRRPNYWGSRLEEKPDG